MDDAIFTEAFDRLPLMAILRGYGPERTVELSITAWELGIDVVEVPIQSDGDLRALEQVVAEARRRERSAGAGTVTTLERVEAARDTGAAFTVAPGFSAEVAAASLDAGMPHLPGVATATEVQHALGAGFTWLKMFPASDLGQDWAASMHGPFPDARFVATGGIGFDNARSFLGHGASAVSLGSALADPSAADKLGELTAALSSGGRS